MPRIIYKCNVCGTEYVDENNANECEKKTVYKIYDLDVGDKVTIKYGYLSGNIATVLSKHISSNHYISYTLGIRNNNGVIEDTFSAAHEDVVPFIDFKMPEIAERMGEAVHNLWMAKRKNEKGWHAPEDCPGNNSRGGSLCYSCCFWLGVSISESKCRLSRLGHNEFIKDGDKCPGFSIKRCSQCHDCMRSYKDLPDTEKELDRAYPTEFFKILYEMGLMITSKPTI